MDGMMGTVAFGRENMENVLVKMSAAQIEKLAFGAAQLDLIGKDPDRQRREGPITGRDPKAAIGKNFFPDIALQ